jgi:hypothetical protein
MTTRSQVGWLFGDGDIWLLLLLINLLLFLLININ